ncbi:hypothetical protein [Rahnella sp. AN3-3W3]|uniref:hypothetical protein n=1 Tax=Rahnella sp. AN3-3W3 TaxID=1610578 RepID=UPI0013003DD5|nr:hypothetical protein [Rahnella sp. AN3-3W3]
MRKLLIAVLALGLAGCNESDEKVIAYGQNEISQNLKDPTSPLFRDVFFHKDEKNARRRGERLCLWTA